MAPIFSRRAIELATKREKEVVLCGFLFFRWQLGHFTDNCEVEILVCIEFQTSKGPQTETFAASVSFTVGVKLPQHELDGRGGQPVLVLLLEASTSGPQVDHHRVRRARAGLQHRHTVSYRYACELGVHH